MDPCIQTARSGASTLRPLKIDVDFIPQMFVLLIQGFNFRLFSGFFFFLGPNSYVVHSECVVLKIEKCWYTKYLWWPQKCVVLKIYVIDLLDIISTVGTGSFPSTSPYWYWSNSFIFSYANWFPMLLHIYIYIMHIQSYIYHILYIYIHIQSYVYIYIHIIYIDTILRPPKNGWFYATSLFWLLRRCDGQHGGCGLEDALWIHSGDAFR